MKKISKYIEYIQTRIIQKFKNRKYSYNSILLKYMYFPNKKSNNLIVVFSACTREGVKARYNYFRTLKNVKANKLFILDDFGDDKRGEWYLGENPKFDVEQAVMSLVKKKSLHMKKIFFVGSSKGGWAALNFGLTFNDAIIIVGAPQFYLGNYLSDSPNIITYKSMKLNNNSITKLNNKLKIEIQDYKDNNVKIYLHYSKNEHTYNDHIQDLIKYLKKYNYKLEENIEKYNNHGEVSYYFPKYLLTILEGENKND